jgi:hypothetical protein
MASAAQVAARFGLGRAVAYARLCGLVRLGLLDHKRIFHNAAGVYLATQAGLASAGLGLPPARVDLRSYNHDLELNDLVIELEREFGQANVSTEREMRAADAAPRSTTAAERQFAVPLLGGRNQVQLTPVGHQRLHFSDSAARLEHGQRIVAVELERTAKGRSRLRRILAGYVGARHVERVRYVVTNDRVLRLVESEVSRAHAERLVEIQLRRAPAAGVEAA